jgi:hypothetical protein
MTLLNGNDYFTYLFQFNSIFLEYGLESGKLGLHILKCGMHRSSSGYFQNENNELVSTNINPPFKTLCNII